MYHFPSKVRENQNVRNNSSRISSWISNFSKKYRFTEIPWTSPKCLVLRWKTTRGTRTKEFWFFFFLEEGKFHPRRGCPVRYGRWPGLQWVCNLHERSCGKHKLCIAGRGAQTLRATLYNFSCLFIPIFLSFFCYFYTCCNSRRLLGEKNYVETAHAHI